MTIQRREPSMPVSDVAERLNLSIYRVYSLSRQRRRKAPIFQRIYVSHSRFEISMASVAAYEAYLSSINDIQAHSVRPRTPINLARGVRA